jgi:hypothetical protein
MRRWRGGRRWQYGRRAQRDGATLLGDGRKTSVGGACLANSALFHGRAQEDTCGAAHFGTILIPLLTALVEARGSADRATCCLRCSPATRQAACWSRRTGRKTTPRRFPRNAALRHAGRGGRRIVAICWDSMPRAVDGGARQRRVVHRRHVAVLCRRHRRVALPGRRGRTQRAGRGSRAGARGIGLGAERVRGQGSGFVKAASRAVDCDVPEAARPPRPGLVGACASPSSRSRCAPSTRRR